MSSNYFTPKVDTSDMDSGEERSCIFSITRRNATPAFEVKEGTFNEMPPCVQFSVKNSRLFAIFLCWNDGRHTLLFCGLENNIRVIAFVRKKMFGTYPFNQTTCLRTISCGTLCNKDSDRQTVRIHGQMYLCVEPPFVRLMS